jgi:hypothetical protein
MNERNQSTTTTDTRTKSVPSSRELEQSELSWDLWFDDVCATLNGMPQFDRGLRPRLSSTLRSLLHGD